MAPDLSTLGSKDRWDYSTPGSTGYDIPNIVYDVSRAAIDHQTEINVMQDPSSRKLKILTIGAGLSGIQMAYQIQKHCENVDHVIYEKNADIGGTWLENRYPGCACDIPSHAYTLNFALNPDWPRFFSYAPDIQKYLLKVVEVFDLRKYMTFNTEVVRAMWQDGAGKWRVTLRQVTDSGEENEFDEECDLLLYVTGILNNYKWPGIKGINSFKNKIRPHVKHLDVFVRTGVWFVQIANNYGQNKEYSQEERHEFRNEPRKLLAHAKDIENQVNGLWGAFYSNSDSQKEARSLFRARMKEFIKDERLLEGFTPKFEIGCRRITPGDPYIEAIQQENVDVHFTAVDEINETGVVGNDGIHREVDTIVCATGFDVTYKPRFSVIGKNGVDLYEKWMDEPESYLGLGCPDMPNWIMFVGPTCHRTALKVAEYTIQIIKKMQRDHIKSWVPKQEITDRFNEHAQEWIKHTVWKDDCRSWYKNNDTGRVNAVWPGSSNHYSENPWAHLGMGYAKCNVEFPNSDVSPYLALENIDPKWLKAIGYTGPALEVERAKKHREESVVQRTGVDGGVGAYPLTEV
ncbi:FAD/NAD(P)-binding domain-containing protein [Ophiobolus disseminans]|uniref:FAD/NAD(P)-binding domain-containing protein n=1 Tax=Ophiobolus disseminans TaxID=1469910 RepID=A0A6A6ZVH8_9PLEO|nr:FAD/NAD(P)-binding domain-containing protein [Ophiobolus disseminans]